MRWRAVIVLAGAAVVSAGPLAAATAIPQRTERISDGPSHRPAITRGGTILAFDSDHGDANQVRDVFVKHLGSGRIELVSSGLAGSGADGPSEGASISARAERIVFSSRATNLVEGDGNQARDVFARSGGGPIVRVSVAQDGSEANGPSYDADVSDDGNRVVFTSNANNLVPVDVNGVEDVFVRDLARGTTRLISTAGATSASGRSRAPSISPDGRFVSFESTAEDIVTTDDNGVADVFLADLQSGSIRRVSVSSRERGQNRAVTPPFVTVSDVSEGGRYVAWDSDADNLVAGDRNRDTDVFVRDVRRGRTEVVSRSSTGARGDNDSYFPRLSPDGRYVGFSSFARNLWPVDRGDEDVFVHDRRLRTTTVLTVNSDGSRRGPERVRQLLRRPSFSDGARRVAFTSSATLTRDDSDATEDVFLRRTDPPNGRIVSGPAGTVRTRRPRLRLAADDRRAVFLCRLDRGRPFFCPRDGRLPRLARGRHRLTVRAGGPGILFEARPSVRVFRVR